MKVDVSAVLLDFNREPLLQQPSAAGALALIRDVVQSLPPEQQHIIGDRLPELTPPVTLRAALAQALSGNVAGLAPEELVTLFQIMVKLPAQGEIDLYAQEIVLLQKALAATHNSPLLLGQCHALVEGKDPFSVPSTEG